MASLIVDSSTMVFQAQAIALALPIDLAFPDSHRPMIRMAICAKHFEPVGQ
jgi:hypothetical protein